MKDLNNWDGYNPEKRGPISIGWKVAGALVVLGVIFVVAASLLGWFGEAAQVAKEEFGPRAALEKYEWFKEQAQAIKKMDKDLSIFEERLHAVDSQYESYGKDRAKWPLDIRVQYNHAKSMVRDDLVAIASQRNNLVKDYNAASSKFNWSPFQTNPDKPNENFQEYKIP